MNSKGSFPEDEGGVMVFERLMRARSLRNLGGVGSLIADRSRATQDRDDPLGRADVESKRLFAAAMAGEFVCSFCSHPGPHDDIGQGQGSEIAFSCARCGKLLDEAALKHSVRRTRGRSSPDAHGASS